MDGNDWYIERSDNVGGTTWNQTPALISSSQINTITESGSLWYCGNETVLFVWSEFYIGDGDYIWARTGTLSGNPPTMSLGTAHYVRYIAELTRDVKLQYPFISIHPTPPMRAWICYGKEDTASVLSYIEVQRASNCWMDLSAWDTQDSQGFGDEAIVLSEVLPQCNTTDEMYVLAEWNTYISSVGYIYGCNVSDGGTMDPLEPVTQYATQGFSGISYYDLIAVTYRAVTDVKFIERHGIQWNASQVIDSTYTYSLTAITVNYSNPHSYKYIFAIGNGKLWVWEYYAGSWHTKKEICPAPGGVLSNSCQYECINRRMEIVWRVQTSPFLATDDKIFTQYYDSNVGYVPHGDDQLPDVYNPNESNPGWLGKRWNGTMESFFAYFNWLSVLGIVIAFILFFVAAGLFTDRREKNDRVAWMVTGIGLVCLIISFAYIAWFFGVI